MNQKCIRFTASITAIFLFKFITGFDDNIIYSIVSNKIDKPLKYILLWNTERKDPFDKIGFEQTGFIKRNCTHNNCFLTANRTYLANYSQFHAVVFNVVEASFQPLSKFPLSRSPDQKYVFSSMEPSHYYPLCSNRFDNYFNWTWSFRLDSDCRLEYIAIRDRQGNVIGPNQIMHWMKVREMSRVSKKLKRSLRSKTKAAAWIASNCHSKGGRREYVRKLQYELRKYNHTIDIYGGCGSLSCPRNDSQKCFELIKKDYYFYLSFENSFSVDYVTEKLLTALKNDAIPIVYGEANYTRFMPDGIYLNARTLGPKKLAQKMDYLIRNPSKYRTYFKWRNHYSYHSRDESEDTDDFCAFCKLLNDEEKFCEKSVVKNIREWWDSPDFC